MEHRHVQQINRDHCHDGHRYWQNSFHVVGLDRRGAIVLRQKCSRGQIEVRLAVMPRCLIGMEACVGAHHLSRKLQSHFPHHFLSLAYVRNGTARGLTPLAAA
jgi:transposase